jgi:hypothetical protein
MSHSPSSSRLTSQDFEQEVLTRLRIAVKILPAECRIYREPWDSSTVVCFNFEHCPYWLEVVKEKADIIVDEVKKWGMAKSVIFRQGSQLKGWRNIA